MTRNALEFLEDRRLLASIPVTTAADSGEGSLRAAIIQANATPGSDTITFNIPALEGNVIRLTSESLPAIQDTVIIDGTVQPGGGTSTTPLIQIDGSMIPSSIQAIADGLTLALPVGTSPSTIRGLAITGFSGTGIRITGAGSNAIQGNYIGLNLDGKTAAPNAAGVEIAGSTNNTIGSTSVALINVISGNTGPGVRIVGASTTGNAIQGNLIGTDSVGTTARPNATGVLIASAANNTVGGTLNANRNYISGNSGSGIEITGTGATGNVITGNYVGLTQSGSVALGNAVGIRLGPGAASNTIGGTSTSSVRNIISGNATIQVHLVGATNNVIQGNTLGLDSTGAAVVTGTQASLAGLAIEDGSTGNTIGGTTALAGNVISGSSGAGIQIRGKTSSTVATAAANNLIQGNYIGTDVNGLTRQGNGLGGVRFTDGTTGNTLGGTAGGLARNVISGNIGNGVMLVDAATTGNVIQANTIGLAPDNTTSLGNTGAGIYVDGAVNNQIGSSLAAASNTIAGNDQAGVFVNSGNGIAIRRNAIYDNKGLGIDLAPVGVNPNRPFEPNNGGPNLFQNYPVITSVTTLNSTTTIAGTLNAAPSTAYTIEFFSNATQDPSGHGQGRTFVGTTNVTTDATGKATFTFSSASVTLGAFVTATATDPNGNTSEFAADVVNAAPSADLVLTLTAAPEPVAAGGILTYTLTATNNGPSNATNVIVTNTLPGTVSFVGATSTTGPISQSGSTITATLGTLTPGQTATVRITVVTSTPGTISDTATVTLAETDPNPSNNTQTVSTTVVAGVDLVVTATSSPAPATVGLPVTLSFVVTNSSTTTTATNVTLTAPLPSGVTVGSASATQGTASAANNTLVAGIGSLAPGVSARVNVVLTPTATGTLTTVATVTATEPEVNPASNTAGSVVTVNAATPPVTGDGPIVLALDRAGYRQQPTLIQVLYDGPMQVSSTTARSNYRLFSAGPDGKLGTNDDRRIRFRSVLYDDATRIVTLRTRKRISLHERLLFAINGTTTTGVRGSGGLLLDGDADGSPGSNFIRRFKGVGPGRLALS